MLSKTQIKYIHSLRQKKYRQRTGHFIAEGVKQVDELLKEDRITVEAVFATGEWMKTHPVASTTRPQLQATIVSEAELNQLSALETAPEVLALCGIPAGDLPNPSGRVTLALEAVRDPGNLGTIIRIADWFGLETIVCSPDCVDAYNPKTIQATMGSIARVSVRETELEAWIGQYPEVPVLAAMLEGEPVTAFAGTREAILVIGNESRGVSAPLAARAARHITIPRLGGAESLNAAIATAILVERLLL